MKSVTLLVLAFSYSFSFQLFAQTPSNSNSGFCEDRKDDHFIKDLTLDSKNLMAFTNHGGLANGGVCWWHSRFQRNALYLTIYKPEIAKPNSEEIKKIISDIRDAKKMVTITGYNNFQEFSAENEKSIQVELEKWQKGDGVIRFAWVKGLSGSTTVESSELKSMMDKLYEDVEVKNNISYNKLQLPGVTSHAWLVVHMEKVIDGYNLEVLDSNYPDKTQIYNYRAGDKDLIYRAAFRFSPYLEREAEMDQIRNTIFKTCDPEGYKAKMKKEADEKRQAEEEKNA